MTPMTELADRLEKLASDLKDARQAAWDATARGFDERIKAIAVREVAQSAFNREMGNALPTILAALRPQPQSEDRVERVARAIYDSMFAPHERCWGDDPRLRERYMDTARAALAAMPAPQTGEVEVGWQPIETAPIDRPILWRQHASSPVSVIDIEFYGECYLTPGSLWHEIPACTAQEPAPDRAQEQEGGA